MNVYGRQLKAQRLAKGLGMRRAAKQAGISPGYWCNLENGVDRLPSAATATRIESVVGPLPVLRCPHCNGTGLTELGREVQSE